MLSCKDPSLKDVGVLLRARILIRLHTFLRQDCRRYLRRLRPAPGAPAQPVELEGGDRPPPQVSPVVASREPSLDSEVVIYTTSWCPYCRRAKALLDRKGVDYFEIDVHKEPAKRREMTTRAGGRTSVPQIFIRGHAIGGSDELRALEASGQLDRLLGRD
jgi:glutaredoxin 3